MNEETPGLRESLESLLGLTGLKVLKVELGKVTRVGTDENDRRVDVKRNNDVEHQDAIWIGTGRPAVDSIVLLIWSDDSPRVYALSASKYHSSIMNFSEYVRATVGDENLPIGFRFECDDQTMKIIRRTASESAIEISADGKIEIGKPSKLEKSVLGETFTQKIKDIFDGLRSRPISLDVLTGPEMMEPSTSAWLAGELATFDDCLSEDVKNG